MLKALPPGLALLALLASPIAAQALWVVDAAGGPGSDFTDVPPAIQAASPGDVVLVRAVSGVFYSGFTLDKSLSLVSDPLPASGGNVFIPSFSGQIIIENVTGMEPVRVTRFGVFGDDPNRPVLIVRNCTAPIWFESLTIEAFNNTDPDGSFIRDVVRIEDASRVLFSRSGVRSDAGFLLNEPGFRALAATNSNIYAHESSFEGAEGRDGYLLGGSFGVIQPTPGQDALSIESGKLFLNGTTVRGGRGGRGFQRSGTCYPSGNGGNGAIMTAGAALVRLNSPIQGANAGAPATNCPSGVAGVGLGTSGSVLNLSGNAVRQTPAAMPWRAGQLASYRFFGAPGELVFLLYSNDPLPVELLGFGGLLLPANPIVMLIGTIPSQAFLPFDFNIPATPPAVPVQTLYLQAAHLTLGAGVRLGTPTSATWLGAGF